jgi:type I restriction enzyme, S subunit
MRSNYKKLGRYIKEVNKRNSELKVDLLLGVSIQKVLMPSIANTVGTDMTTYKIINRNQFAYGPVTSRNGNKISVAILEDNDEAIISQAYVVFEVINPNELLPEYLMMWFRRPEFDRYARYKSHGSAREIFDWEEMCEVELPVPPIEKQREIVAEYHAVQKRIQINEQLIQKLEETAQAVYRRWFAEFEFPDENGNPYKSSGGEMVDSLFGPIPIEWEVGSLFDLIELQRGFDLPTQNRKEGKYPIFASTGTNEKHSEFKVKAPGIVTGRSGSLGEVFYVDEDFWPLNTTLWVKHFKKATPIYTYYVLKGINIIDYNGGSAVPTLNRNDIHRHQLIVPEKEVVKKFEKIQQVFFKQEKILNQENQKLTELKELLLSKLATSENYKNLQVNQ